jgi:hypothetical protein
MLCNRTQFTGWHKQRIQLGSEVASNSATKLSTLPKSSLIWMSKPAMLGTGLREVAKKCFVCWNACRNDRKISLQYVHPSAYVLFQNCTYRTLRRRLLRILKSREHLMQWPYLHAKTENATAQSPSYKAHSVLAALRRSCVAFSVPNR